MYKTIRNPVVNYHGNGSNTSSHSVRFTVRNGDFRHKVLIAIRYASLCDEEARERGFPDLCTIIDPEDLSVRIDPDYFIIDIDNAIIATFPERWNVQKRVV